MVSPNSSPSSSPNSLIRYDTAALTCDLLYLLPPGPVDYFPNTSYFPVHLRTYVGLAIAVDDGIFIPKRHVHVLIAGDIEYPYLHDSPGEVCSRAVALLRCPPVKDSRWIKNGYHVRTTRCP